MTELLVLRGREKCRAAGRVPAAQAGGIRAPRGKGSQRLTWQGVRGFGSIVLLRKCIECGEQDDDHNGKDGPESHEDSSCVSIAESASVIGAACVSV